LGRLCLRLREDALRPLALEEPADPLELAPISSHTIVFCVTAVFLPTPTLTVSTSFWCFQLICVLSFHVEHSARLRPVHFVPLATGGALE